MRRTMTVKMIITAIVILALAPFCMAADFKYESGGRRDPFVPLIGKEKPTVIKLEDVTSIEDIMLEGIAIEPKGKKAVMLNGMILKENDKVGYVEIKKISNETVTLSIGSNTYNIALSEKGGKKE